MKRLISYTLSIALILTIIIVPISMDDVQAATNKVSKPKHAKSVKKSKSSIKISWSKVTDADGYVIYRKAPGKKKYKKVKTIKGSSKTKWVNKKLKKNKTYRYKIKAYKKINGKKKYSKFTYSVSSKTYDKKQKKVNARKVSVEYKTRYMGLIAYNRINAVVKTKKKGKKPISTKIRWYSSDKSIAKVDKKGGVKTQGKKGTCSIYAVAHNGVKTKIKVIVNDYANPDKFINLDKTPSVVQKLCTDDKEDLCEIVNYLQRIRGSLVLEMRAGYLQVDYEINDKILDKVEKLMREKKLLGIEVYRGEVTLYVNYVKKGDAAYILYTDRNGKVMKNFTKLADCWYYNPPNKNMIYD